MFDRFSPAARRVLRAAEQASRNHNHYYVGVGHLLLALVEERDPGVEAALARRGARPNEVIAAVRRELGTGEDRLWDGILITPRVRNVVALAARSAGDGPVEPAGLFDALAEEGGGLAADVLARFPAPARLTDRKAG